MKIRIVSSVIIITMMLLLTMLPVRYAESFVGPEGLFDGFVRISAGGFGDPLNNYAWAMAYFKGDLYVGTGRNIPYMAGLGFKVLGLIPWDFEISAVTHPDGSPPPPFGPDPDPSTPGNQYAPNPADVIEWSNDMSAEIWRYHNGMWTRVRKAPTFIGPGRYTYPEGIGYRYMTTFKNKNGEEAIYAGVGQGFGRTLLIMSTDGENWMPVNTSKNIPWPSDTRALAVHNGKLYLGLGTAGEIYASNDPRPIPRSDTWENVVDFEDFASVNTAILSLVSFNGHLYATTQNTETGFEVWRSETNDPTDEWVQVVYGGAGDAWNVWGGTMNTFNGNLYVGSMSLPIPPLGLKGFDLIRIDTEDNWDLIVGNYRPSAPTVPRGSPLSGWPSGFGNPLNFYCWQLEEHCGLLYLGSFDAGSFLRFLPIDIILSQLNQGTITSMIDQLASSGIDEAYVEQLLAILQEIDIGILIQKLAEYLGGADMWISPNGLYWFPLNLNGFNNPNNYGFRTLLSTPDGLYAGTANPFQGCEVWVGAAKTECSVVTDSNYCLFDEDPRTCGQQFRLIFTSDPLNPTQYQLTASNPGQFYYNVFYIGCLEDEQKFTINLPYPFVTKGATPVHVYSLLKIGSDGCFIPCKDITSQLTITPPTVSISSPDYDSFGDEAKITVETNSAFVGLLYITVHVDYDLKKTRGYGRNLNGDATYLKPDGTTEVAIKNYYAHKFKVVFPCGAIDVESVQNVNVFKRNPGFAGIIRDSGSEDPIQGAKVEIYKPDGSKLATLYTDEDGFYYYSYKHTGKAAQYTITASATNYQSQTITLTVKANQFVLFCFQLVHLP